MTDVIELLSSSDDEDNNAPYSNKSNCDSDTSIETDIGNILKKYKSVNDEENKLAKETISSSEDEFDDISQLRSLRERLETKYNRPSTLPSNSKNLNLLLDDNDDDEQKVNFSPSSSQDTQGTIESDEIDIGASKPKKKRSAATNEDKIQKKIEKEREKARKQAEKDELKAEKERQKAETAKAKSEKREIASAYKNLKPDECIKFINAVIDSDLISNECGTDIPNALQTANINYKINSNIHPLTITWKRNNQAQLTNIDGQLKVTKNEDHCDEVLLFIIWDKFIKLVHESNLCNHFKTCRSLLPDKKIFLGIYGLENYFRFQKSQKQKTEKDKNYSASPKISRKDVDMSLIELQLLFGTSHRFVESPQDVSAMVLQFTKSIAQIPYKLQKQLKQQQMDWFVSGDNKDCVRVDKNGNGLYRLWKQQVTQFTLARLETAEAITSKYPSPKSLMHAYEDCVPTEEGEKLLQDIPIRRAAGPLTSLRKIGPELSKKMHTLFTSLDGEILL